MPSHENPTPSLMTLRTAVVLFFSATISCATGTLTYIEKGAASAALAAIAAFAAAALWLHRVIAP